MSRWSIGIVGAICILIGVEVTRYAMRIMENRFLDIFALAVLGVYIVYILRLLWRK
ncbi:hypothetical protein [Ammoniphilus sp. YIM 78166]|uniref:hypothetical protein n=1 Tax=Ammoniphilus sp. YIM 78166 TaxID=1644106 RepID=UPI0014313291|nr:hypothetical protein [Ammoniphilus sp. YIM 78166]